MNGEDKAQMRVTPCPGKFASAEFFENIFCHPLLPVALCGVRKVPAEPGLREEEFGLFQPVAGVAPFEGEGGARLFEEGGEALGAVLRDHLIVAAGEEEDRRIVELWGVWGLEGKHGTEEDGAREDVGAEEEQGGGDVGAVGVADGDHLAEMLAGGLVFNEVGEFVGAADEIVFVEDAGGEAAEEAGLAVFEDLSTRAEQGGAGAEELAERDEVILVATGAVEEEECGGGAGMEEVVHGSFFSHGLKRINEDGLQPCDPGWRQIFRRKRLVCGRGHTAINHLLPSSLI